MEAWIVHIMKELRLRIGAKYPICDLRVFGSSARGDRKTTSDIDVLVCLPELNRAIEEDLYDIAYDLELEHDCLIDLIVVSERDLQGRIGSAPIYGQILTEGVAL